ncbi:MAG: transcriptional repressor [Eubacteriales bacterium]|nr:transcriptional repressor [Eubacteriales bacterium]
MTKNRTLIWNILKRARQTSRHLTAEEIYLLAKKEAPGIAMATVYNNLNFLAETGAIRRVRRSDGPDYFDGNTELHDHMVCDCCGRVSDVTLQDLAARLEERLGVTITGYELNIHYICPECKKKELSVPSSNDTEASEENKTDG